MGLTRRAVILGGGGAFATAKTEAVPAALRTPYKLNRLVVSASGTPGAFDEKAVDCPFVFRHDGRYYMLFIGYDGTGYQTGLASSNDLLDWKPEGLIAGRDPSREYLRYNVALSWIVRENGVLSEGRLKKVRGRYLGVYHAYPRPGYEQGPAAIGLCWSADVRKWEMEPPFHHAAEGAEWERGGLYKPCLVEHEGVFYLFYNAKNAEKSWREQTGVATSLDLRTWKRYEGNPVVRNRGPGSMDEVFAIHASCATAKSGRSSTSVSIGRVWLATSSRSRPIFSTLASATERWSMSVPRAR